jgi:ribonuclease HI
MMMISGALKSAPTKGIEAILGMLPLHLHIREIALKARLRTSTVVKLNNWDGLCEGNQGSHIKSLDDELNVIIPAKMPRDIASGKITGHKVEFIYSGKCQNDSAVTNIYTDGSKMNDHHTGCGWAITHGDAVIHSDYKYLGTESTVFQSEVVAINLALCWIKENRHKPGLKTFNIYSDSKSAIQAIEKPFYKSKLVKECKMNLKKLESKATIKILWIKGHKDHTGNELADMLAKSGTVRVTGVHPELPIPKAAVTDRIDKYLQQEWQKEWDHPMNLDKFRQTRLFIGKVNNSKIYRKVILKRCRRHLSRLVAYVTGHCTLKRHLRIMKIDMDKDQLCRFCKDEDETPSHLITECGSTEDIRLRHMNMFKYRDKQDDEIPVLTWDPIDKWRINHDSLTPELIHLIEDIATTNMDREPRAT